MGIFDRVKNMFTEEVEESVVEENIKEKDEKELEVEEKEEIKVVSKKEEKMMPIFFDDQDFATLEKPKREEHKPLIEEKYYTKKEQPEKKVFKLSPVISPVYGVLDKNYHKEDITPKRSTPKVTYYDSESITIDEVRKKAYGTLEDEIEDTLLAKDITTSQTRVQKNYSDDVLLEELMDPNYEPKRAKKEENRECEIEENIVKPFALDDFLISNDEDEVDYKDPNEDTLTESDLFNLIDSMYDKEDE